MPSRVKTHAMQVGMPKRYGKNLPEASLIPRQLEEALERVRQMIAHNHSRASDEWHPAPAPDTTNLERLRSAAARCKACPLYKQATQTVFGEGPRDAPLVLVGEQPGDQEDRAGQPFVGPAGQLLDRALAEVGIDREAAYVTNAVKHFKWEPRGKRRLHQKPNSRDIAACKPWLEAELRALRPRVLILLGSTAAQTIFGSQVRVLRDRGKARVSDYCEHTFITVHPSSLLRAPDEASREKSYRAFVADLKKAARLLTRTGAKA
jgi:uracil-DNA glycosylase family protein